MDLIDLKTVNGVFCQISLGSFTSYTANYIQFSFRRKEEWIICYQWTDTQKQIEKGRPI